MMGWLAQQNTARTSLRRPCSRLLGRTSLRFRTRSSSTGLALGKQTMATMAPTPDMVTAKSTGTAEASRYDNSPGHAVQHVPEHARRPVHHAGTGLSQAPPSGGPQGGLATLFNNPTYGTIFSTFSPLRLFTPVDSNVTEALVLRARIQWNCASKGQRLRRGLHGR